jgi:putative CocE/NonD family hydrolase
MAAGVNAHDEFFPPTLLESSARSTGADTGRYRIDYLMLPMRDGVRLATVIIRPRSEGRRPAFMIRTPYATTSFERTSELSKALFEAEYVVIVQNERGTEWSEGEFGFLTKTTADAMDTLDWVTQQEWSNGRVGLFGCSSPAENQLKLAAIGHPALHACVAMSSGAGVGSVPGNEGSQGMFYRGGVPMLKTWALWYAPFGIRMRPKLPRVDSDDEMSRILRRYSVSAPGFGDPEYATALDKSLRQAPSGEVLRRMGAPLTGYERFMAVGPLDPAWEDVDLIDASHAGATPSLNINGWLDPGAYETVKLFEFQQHHPDQYLIMAPTEHCSMTKNAALDASLGDRPMGDTRLPYDEIFRSWFDRWLRDEPDAWKPMPRVQVFLMGAGTWLTGDTWPLPDTRERTLFLVSGGSANTLWGDGELSPEALLPAAADHFLADPHNPVPSLGGFGENSPCVDQRPAECRADVLVYSTPPLAEAVSIVGDVSAELYVSADVPDTDVFVKLVDVYPDGTAYNVADTCLRLRYRGSLSRPEPLVPGQLYRIELRGITTANHFPPGHRIRVEVAGSSFPYRDRNWNTGGQNELDSDGPIAHITLHHGPDHPSLIRFREYTGPIGEVKD